jgi:Protein of unknown function (DUF3467)
MPKEQKPPHRQDIAELGQLSSGLETITVIRSDTYKTIYSNLYRTRVGSGEMTIIFNKVTHSPSILATGNIVEEQVEIIMPWPQIKMFEQTLKSIIDAFEQEVGVIPIPTSFQVNAEGQREAVRSLGLPSTERQSAPGHDSEEAAPTKQRPRTRRKTL